MMKWRAKPIRSPMQRRRHILVVVTFFVGLAIFPACATQSTVQLQQPFPSGEHRPISIERCVDRTEYKGERNLAEEATQTLKEKVLATKLFDLTQDATLVLTCDLERFAEGSAFQRWLLPGWGATEARIAIMVWEKPGDKVLATFRSHSSVAAGGFYTVGADQYIISVAVSDVVGQLETWARDVPTGREIRHD